MIDFDASCFNKKVVPGRAISMGTVATVYSLKGPRCGCSTV